MPLAELIQRIIQLLDVGRGPRVLRTGILVLVFLCRCLWLDLHDYKNFSNPEAMDSAQLARNLAEGRGYTTDFIRPLSIYLVGKWNMANNQGSPGKPDTDFARLQTGHPDLQNPPVYPMLLAGLMKVLPFRYQMEFRKSFWSADGRFSRYEPDFLIATFNQLLMGVLIWQIFGIARKLFDLEVAVVTAVLVFGSEWLWNLSISGLSILLVMVIFLGLTRLLIAYEEASRAPEVSPNRLMLLAIAAGLLTGVGGLTLYSFGWMLAPLILFLVLYGGPDRVRHALAAACAFLALFAPWVLRNYLVSGTPFGTAGFAVMSGTFIFSEFQLERMLHPHLTLASFLNPYLHKLWPNLEDILQNDLPRLGRSWAVMLFLAGLLLKFRAVAIRRTRYFLMMSLGMLAVVQALGRTQLSVVTPELNSENLLVLALPLIMMFGTVFFITFMDQFDLPEVDFQRNMRYVFLGIFVLVMCLPAVGKRMAGDTNPVVYPPYYPPEIQLASGWLRPNELMMSDIPWAVAWYGHRQCVWLSLNTKDDFYAINDELKPVNGLFLSTDTLDLKMFSDGFRSAPNSWGNFVFKQGTTDDPAFPLRMSPGAGVINSGLFLTDRPRWLAPLQ